MPIALRIYNIFCWNSSLKEKPTELHWLAHTSGWRPKPVMLKPKAQTTLTTFNFKKHANNKNEPCKYTRQTQQD